MDFNENISIEELLKDKYIGKYIPYIFYDNNYLEKMRNYKIKDCSLLALEGINFLYNQTINGNVNQYFVDENRPFASFIHFTHHNHSKVFFIVSGGGLTSVCHIHEGLPMSKVLFEAGYDILLVTYGVFENGYKYGPIGDLANSIKYCINNEKELNIDMEKYMLLGGSAGGYIVGQFGTSNHGYKHFNLPKPALSVMLYPVIDLSIPYRGETKKWSIGLDAPIEEVNEWSINKNVDKDYPHSYFVHSDKDPLVPIENSYNLKDALIKNNIPFFFKEFHNEVHGWSTGKGLNSEGWMNHLIRYIKDNI